jgi:flagellar biosynthesis regulator FlbT
MKTTSLRIDAGAKAIIGGMVVENTSGSDVELTVHGDGPVLESGEIINAKDADTPALRLYYVVMSMYVAPEKAFSDWNRNFIELSHDIVASAPSTSIIISEIGALVAAGKFEEAMKKCMYLLAYEDHLNKIAANG